jgi:hypothetical protein
MLVKKPNRVVTIGGFNGCEPRIFEGAPERDADKWLFFVPTGRHCSACRL